MLTITNVILEFRGIKIEEDFSASSESTAHGGQRKAQKLAFWSIFHDAVKENHCPAFGSL